MVRAARGLVAGVVLACLGGCFSLQKVNPGTRYVDDFETDDLIPTWQRFGPWMCLGLPRSQPDAGQADSQAPDCKANPQPPADGGKYALEVMFQLTEPPDGSVMLGAEAITQATSGPVDLAGFTQIVFEAYLESAPAPLGPLPLGTQVQVELGCSAFVSDPVASQPVSDSVEAASWAPASFRLPLDMFHQQNAARSSGCLAQVDSIGFAVLLPALTAGTSTGGTLHIDNITLQN
jgi:hypothetical protein